MQSSNNAIVHFCPVKGSYETIHNTLTARPIWDKKQFMKSKNACKKCLNKLEKEGK